MAIKISDEFQSGTAKGILANAKEIEYNPSETGTSAVTTVTVAINNLKKEVVENGSAFDITKYNNNTTYSGLTQAISGNNVPVSERSGGMSVKFVNSTTNKYEQWRYVGTVITGTSFTTLSNWMMGSGGDGVFDISGYSNPATPVKYANLQAALGTDGANVPSNLRTGGMTVKFINSSTNKYEEWRYMINSVTNSDFTTLANWQGIDDKPMKDSQNLVKSGSVYDAYINQVYLTGGDTSAPEPVGFIASADTVWNKGEQIIPASAQTQVRENLGFGDGNIDAKPTSGSTNVVTSGGIFQDIVDNGFAFDITKYNNGASYSGLTEALNGVPDEYRKGGMNVRFMNSSENKYVKFFNTSSGWTTTVSEWEGVDEYPVENSNNLVRSGSVYDAYTHQVFLEEDSEVPEPASFDPEADTVHVTPQVLSEAQKTQARANLGFGNGDIDSVPTAGSDNLVKSVGVAEELALGSVYDVSAHNGGTTFASLSALLSDANLNTLIPTAVRKGGMSIKYVQSSDNKYLQYRLMATLDNPSTAAADFTNEANWQSENVDALPVGGSKNLIESGGVAEGISQQAAQVSVKTGGEITPNLIIEQGGISSTTGDNDPSNTRVRTQNYIYADTVSITVTNGKLYVFGYEEDGTYVSGAGWVTSQQNVAINGAVKYRFAFVSSNGDPVTPSNFPSLGVTIKSLFNGTLATKEELSSLEGDVDSLEQRVDLIDVGGIVPLTNDDVTLNYYRNKNGSISSLSNFFYSAPISVVKGDSFSATDISSSSAQSTIAMLSWVTENNNFLSLILNPNEAGSYSYTFEHGGYVSISGQKNDLSKFAINKMSVVSLLNNEINALSDEINALSDDIESVDEKVGSAIDKITTDDIIPNHYRRSRGGISELNNFFYSNPIFVKKGDVLKANDVSSTSANSAIGMFTKVDVNNKFIALLLNPSVAGTYTYTMTEDGYICISGYITDLSKFTVTRNTTLFDSVVTLCEQVDKLSVPKYDANTRLPQLTENPVEHINYNCGLMSIFKTIGVIGDSLASGEMQGWNAQGERVRIDMYELSWGQQIAKMTGVDVYNFSKGGQYAKGWMNGNTERTWDAAGTNNGASVNLKQCYFIGLAHNDKTMVDNNTYSQGIGTVADINDLDYTQNADSYVGWYARIIQALKTIEPRAYIFCITPPSEIYADYSAQIRNIVEHFTGQRVYLIDLALYGMDHNATWRSMGDHLSAAGYLYAAYEIANYVDWIIRKNGEDFKYTSLVGTDLYDTNPTA